MFCPSCGKEVTPGKVSAINTTSAPQKKKKSPFKPILSLVILAMVLMLSLIMSGCSSPDDDSDGDFNSGSGNGGNIIAVTNPNFQLSNGFVVPVQQKQSAPTGFIAISTAAEFNKIRQNSSANYILMADIDLSGLSWTPIPQFNGTLDGNGYTVSGLNATLIDKTKDALIQNLRVQGQITDYSAGIVKQLEYSVLYNCSFSGSVDNNSSSAAGLVYNIEDSTIDSCYNTANITVYKGYAAGVAAYASGEQFVIQNCFNQGNVRNLGNSDSLSYNYAAGILARSVRCSGIIRHCYNAGSIRCEDSSNAPVYSYYGNAIACGILSYCNVPEDYNMSISMCYNSGTIEGGDLAFGIGLAWGTSALRMQVSNCYNNGYFTHSNSYGIAGCVSDSGHIENVQISYCYNASTTGAAAISNNSTSLYKCYYLNAIPDAVSGGPLFSDVFALSEQQMSKKNSFDFDFSGIWTMGKGDYTYPVFGYRNFNTVDDIA